MAPGPLIWLSLGHAASPVGADSDPASVRGTGLGDGPAVVVIALVVLSWTLEPLMNSVLLLSRDRHLLGAAARRATYAFLAFAAAAAACVVFGMTTGPHQLLLFALGLALWAMATGSGHTVRPGVRRQLATASAVAAVVAAVGITVTVAGIGGAVIAMLIVLIGGVVALWRTALT